MSRTSLAASILVLASGSSAFASVDDVDSDELADDFDPLAFQLGLGLAGRGDQDTSFDGTLRLGKTWRARRFVHPGGFFEIHTAFHDIDVSIGPQLQIPISEIARVQVRAGVGLSPNTSSFALAGVQLGHAFVGGTVTARRSFETGELAVSVDVELQPLMILLAALLRD